MIGYYSESKNENENDALSPKAAEQKQSPSVISDMLFTHANFIQKQQRQKDELPSKMAKRGAFLGGAISAGASTFEYYHTLSLISLSYRTFLNMERYLIGYDTPIESEIFKRSLHLPRMFFSVTTFGLAGYFLGNRMAKKKIEHEENNQMDMNSVAVLKPD